MPCGGDGAVESHVEQQLSILVHELAEANHRADEAERFTRNLLALQEFARPDQLPPLTRAFRPRPRPEAPRPQRLGLYPRRAREME
jgi:hypothetical protein